MTIMDTIKKSTLAGVLIGLGVIINLQVDNRFLGALLFSFGLLTIIKMKLNLFTGKVGYLKNSNQINYLMIVLLYNLCGIAVTVSIYACANDGFMSIIKTAATIKFSKNIITLFINAIFCGMLIHFAVKSKNAIIVIFAIMIFILIGAEHCIADFAYFTFYMYDLPNLFDSILKFIAIILGNSIGAILIERFSE